MWFNNLLSGIIRRGGSGQHKLYSVPRAKLHGAAVGAYIKGAVREGRSLACMRDRLASHFRRLRVDQTIHQESAAEEVRAQVQDILQGLPPNWDEQDPLVGYKIVTIIIFFAFFPRNCRVLGVHEERKEVEGKGETERQRDRETE